MLGCLDAWMLGCLDAWMLGCLCFGLLGSRFDTNLNHIWEAFGHLWCLLQGPVARLGQPGYPNELFGTPVQGGAPIYGDLLASGARRLAACGSCGGLWGPGAAF